MATQNLDIGALQSGSGLDIGARQSPVGAATAETITLGVGLHTGIADVAELVASIAVGIVNDMAASQASMAAEGITLGVALGVVSASGAAVTDTITLSVQLGTEILRPALFGLGSRITPVIRSAILNAMNRSARITKL